MMHSDNGAKSNSKKRKILPAEKRVIIGLCEIGDVIELSDGRRCVVTGWLNGGPFGRWLSDDGTESEFMPVDSSLVCRVIGGFDRAR